MHGADIANIDGLNGSLDYDRDVVKMCQSYLLLQGNAEHGVLPRHNSRFEPAIIVLRDQVLALRFGRSADGNGIVVGGKGQRTQGQRIRRVDWVERHDHYSTDTFISKGTVDDRRKDVPCLPAMMMLWD